LASWRTSKEEKKKGPVTLADVSHRGEKENAGFVKVYEALGGKGMKGCVHPKNKENHRVTRPILSAMKKREDARNLH